MTRLRRILASLTSLVVLAGVLTVGGVVAPAAAASTTVSGTIRATDTNAVLGGSTMHVSVQAYNGGTDTWSEIASTTPNGSGVYSVVVPELTTVRFEVYQDGVQYGDVWWTSTGVGYTFYSGAASTVTFAPTAGTYTVDLNVPPVGSIRSEWVDPANPDNQLPLGDIDRTLYKLTNGQYVEYIPTSGLGDINFFNLRNLPVGLYRIGYVDERTTPDRYVDQFFPGQPTLATGVDIQVNKGVALVLDDTVLVGPTFSDVPNGALFHDEITWMLLQRISTGYLNSGVRTYDPLAVVSREAMAAFLYRSAGNPVFTPPSTPSFTDVPTSHFFFKEIEWMKTNGITTGNADGTFAPNAPVSRQAMAAFLYRAAGSPAFTPPTTASFTDYSVGATFYKEIEWMKAEGITTGYDNGNGTWSYHPIEDVSRQAMGAFLFRANH